MSQCVPSWDLDNNSAPPIINVQAHSNSASSILALDVPRSLDYEVAELTWENGQLSMHGLAAPRVGPTKPPATWDKPRAGAGTLESLVNQATAQVNNHHHPLKSADNNVNELVPWFDHPTAVVNPAASASLTVTMDALVPCNNISSSNNNNNNNKSNTHRNMETRLENSGHALGGSCSGRVGCRSVGESATRGGRESRQMTLDTCERGGLGGGGYTSTSLWSQENTISSGKEYTRTSAEDHDSFCHGRSQREVGSGDRKRKGIGKSPVSTKSRAAAIHNQSERKRRDKINQRMKTLQKMVPNSSKTDKASMLDEVIEYLKQLQAQVQMMRMNMPSMMMPLAMQQQQLQMSMMAPPMPITMAMGMGHHIMDINSIARAAAAAGMPQTAAFMPMPSWDIPGGGDRSNSPAVMMPDFLSTFLACQSQPMTVDAYSRLAALYQQFQQPPASGSKN